MKYLPNILTIIRLFMVPLFVNTFFANTHTAVGIFVLACATDVLDGFIARRYNCISKFGMLADPLADKLMQLSALICLCIAGILPLWAVVFVLVKEFAMMLGALFLLNKKIIIPSNKIGKIGTVIIASAIVYCIAVPEALPRLSPVLPYVIAGMSLVSLCVYIFMFAVSQREQNKH